jgi:Flp pilus assembly protein TadG
MYGNFPLRGLFERLSAFARSCGGNVAITFGIAAIPTFGLMGAALDYTRANSVKAAMQAALDATALMLAKAAPGLSQAEMQQKANDYFNANFNRPGTLNVTVTPNYDTSTSTITVTASGSVPTTLLHVLGMSELGVNTTSAVTWGNTRLRVALALDNTGSMASSGKMTALKTAAQNLLTQLKDAATRNGDVYVSIIPFSKDVNVDPVNYTQSWVRWDLWDAVNGSCKNKNYTDQDSCTSADKKWEPNDHSTWTGCVTDRDQNPSGAGWDTTNTPPSAAVSGTLFPAEQYGQCPVAMMGLTYDWASLSNKITAMQPDGNTNQAIGLQWAWQSLTSAPFTIPPMDSTYKYQQVIILLTDGLNTQDRWYTDRSSIDQRQRLTCDNINAAGITLYTIQVNTSGDPTSTLLQNCAGSPGTYPDPGKFYLLTSATEIITVFKQIGTAISQLHVAK